jgi:hypothetical protein
MEHGGRSRALDQHRSDEAPVLTLVRPGRGPRRQPRPKRTVDGLHRRRRRGSEDEEFERAGKVV